ncbi:hypothetical protein B6K86_00430 [Lachnospiraceae bacterium]|nr:hypothetical protein B6K86_00430 [Lachnospiraceae bacterium]
MKVRVKYAKRGNLRFVGHLDMMRYFQKANRRAALPIAYSEGFSPHQIMSFAAPLGMGLESIAEYFDIRLTDEGAETISSSEAIRSLNAQMAEGIEILSFLRIPDDAKNCMSIVHAADYTLTFLEKAVPEESRTGKAELSEGETEESRMGKTKLSEAVAEEGGESDQSRALAAAVEELLACPELLVTKKGKKGNLREIDIRPMILQLYADQMTLSMRIAQGSEANLKPELLVRALLSTASGRVLSDLRFRILRTELYDAEMNSLESYGEQIE